MYKHVLLPTDGSALSNVAIDSGLQFAKAVGAKVTGFYVMVEHQPDSFEDYAPVDVKAPNLDAMAKQEADQYLKVIADKALALGARSCFHAATQAIKAFGDGNHAEAVRLLRPVRNYAHRFGGSHAQRDLIDLTLIEAAARAGQDRLAAALLAERADRKGEIPAARPRSVTAVRLTATV